MSWGVLPWDCTGFMEYISVLLLWTSELSVCTLVISSVTWKGDITVSTSSQSETLQHKQDGLLLPECWGHPELSAAPPSHPSSACGCYAQTPAETAVTGLHTHTHIYWSTNCGDGANTGRKTEKLYHRWSVSHLGAAWQWCHMGWSRCPDLWPHRDVSGPSQVHQRSPLWLFLIGSNYHCFPWPGNNQK